MVLKYVRWALNQIKPKLQANTAENHFYFFTLGKVEYAYDTYTI